jgi:hypothetical protein
MNSKIKNILILVVVLVVLVLIYIFFIKKGPGEPALTTSSGDPVLGSTNTDTGSQTSEASRDFITVLLSVKNIKLDDSIFKDSAYLSLRDSSISLVQDGNEGRPNPFAPIGSETTVAPPVLPSTTPSITTSTIPETPPSTLN